MQLPLCWQRHFAVLSCHVRNLATQGHHTIRKPKQLHIGFPARSPNWDPANSQHQLPGMWVDNPPKVSSLQPSSCPSWVPRYHGAATSHPCHSLSEFPIPKPVSVIKWNFYCTKFCLCLTTTKFWVFWFIGVCFLNSVIVTRTYIDGRPVFTVSGEPCLFSDSDLRTNMADEFSPCLSLLVDTVCLVHPTACLCK